MPHWIEHGWNRNDLRQRGIRQAKKTRLVSGFFLSYGSFIAELLDAIINNKFDDQLQVI